LTAEKFFGEERIGYIRVPVTECKRSNPKWYRFYSLSSDYECPGVALMNIQYVHESGKMRIPK
jgi:hypothetical protein